MHLLVPGAYQPRLRLRHRLPRVSMHLLMPGAYRPMPGEPSPGPRQSQYTVWCWVLIDRHLYKPRHNAAYSTVVATGDSRTPTRQ